MNIASFLFLNASCFLPPWALCRVFHQPRPCFSPYLPSLYKVNCYSLSNPSDPILSIISSGVFLLFCSLSTLHSSSETLSRLVNAWVLIAICLFKLDLSFMRIKTVSFAHRCITTTLHGFWHIEAVYHLGLLNALSGCRVLGCVVYTVNTLAFLKRLWKLEWGQGKFPRVEGAWVESWHICEIWTGEDRGSTSQTDRTAWWQERERDVSLCTQRTSKCFICWNKRSVQERKTRLNGTGRRG